MEEENKIDNEIDLIDIARKLWIGRKIIITITLISAMLGLIIAVLTPNYYTAYCTMVPQTGDKFKTGNFSGLAAMAGINIGSFNAEEVLSPMVYPKILNNVKFQRELIYSEYSFSKSDKPITFFEYATNKEYRSFNLSSFLKRYTLGLPAIAFGVFSKDKKENQISIDNNNNKEIFSLSEQESIVIEQIIANLSLNLNHKEGYITLSFTSGESKLSAEIVFRAQQLLQQYITEFKLDKVKRNLEFIEKSYSEAKQSFELTQSELAKFRDANKSLSSAMAKTQEEKLTSEYNLLLSVYTELAKQKEQAKIAVTETTPILTIIEPVKKPIQKSGPKRSMIILSYTLIGLVTSIVWLFTYSHIRKNYAKIFT